jgi:hypothetical protein
VQLEIIVRNSDGKRGRVVVLGGLRTMLLSLVVAVGCLKMQYGLVKVPSNTYVGKWGRSRKQGCFEVCSKLSHQRAI